MSTTEELFYRLQRTLDAEADIRRGPMHTHKMLKRIQYVTTNARHEASLLLEDDASLGDIRRSHLMADLRQIANLYNQFKEVN